MRVLSNAETDAVNGGLIPLLIVGAAVLLGSGCSMTRPGGPNNRPTPPPSDEEK
jgi:hypothetical protein